MFLNTWLRGLRRAFQPARERRHAARHIRRVLRAKLNLEILEDRTLPSSIFTVININDSGDGSLRQAILNANALPGLDTINFDVPGTGVHTINVSSMGFGLPTITDAVFIDGYSQPLTTQNTNGPGLGSNAHLLIELNGTDAGPANTGLKITAGGTTIQGLVINRFGNEAIHIETGGGNVIAGNFIGTDAAGMINYPVGLYGVNITGSTNNLIGGPTSAASNVISMNRNGANVLLNGPGASGNFVQGNLIGTNAGGNVALPGNPVGIYVGAAPGNTIGGTTPEARNVIAGQVEGIRLAGADASGNLVQGNFIGTNSAGTIQLVNQFGVSLVLGANGNTIGGTTTTPGAGTGNVIAGNGRGVIFNDAGTTGNKVQGNLIGKFGPAVNSYGVYVNKFVAGNTIGGTEAGTGNTIAFNSLNGVTLATDAGAGNSILGNSIYLNGTTGTLTTNLGIDLGDNGVTPNDSRPHTGANNFQNSPVLASAVSASGSTTVVGTLHGDPSINGFRLEFFASAAADPSGFGEGQLFLGFTTVNTNADGNASFTAVLPTAIPLGMTVVSATATDPSGNTSEFSMNVLSSTAALVDIQLSVDSVSPNPALVGQTYGYNVTVQNAGPDVAQFVSVQVSTAPGTLLDSVVAIDAGIVRTSPTAVTVTFFSMAAGASQTITVNSHALVAGDLIDTVTVATYEQDTNLADNTFQVNHTVAGRAVTAVTVKATPSPSVFGRPVVFTVSTASVNGVFPGGTVELFDINPNPATIPPFTILATLNLDSNGRASFPTTSLALGLHQIRAGYSGSATFDAAFSGVTLLTIRLAGKSTWDGGGADDNWTTAANWVGDGGAAPGDALIFPDGAARRNNVNDFAPGSLFTNITFTGGDYFLHGNSIVLNGNLNNLWADLEATDLIGMDITLTGAVQFLTIPNVNATLQLDGQISGMGGMVKAGKGRLILGGNNTYLGSTLINEGIVVMATPTALGAGALGTTVSKLGTLRVALLADPVKEPLTLAGRLEGFLSRGWSGSIALAGSYATIDVFRFLSMPFANSFTLSGTVSGAAPLFKTGDGALILTGNNNYRGSTIVRAGVLSVRSANALGTPSSGTEIDAGATLDIQGGLTVKESLVMGGTLRSLSGNNTWTGRIELFADSYFRVDEDQLTINAVISSTKTKFNTLVTGLTKLGEGKLQLLQANTYIGRTTVQEGVLNIQHYSALGATTGASSFTTVLDGAALELQAPFVNVFRENIILAGTGIENTGALRNIFGTNVLTGSVTLKNGAFIGVDSSRSLTITGALYGATTDGLGKVGSGVLRLMTKAAATIFQRIDIAFGFQGSISIFAGTLELNDAIRLGDTANGTTVYGGARLLFAATAKATIAEPVILMTDATLELGTLNTSTWTGALTLAGTATVKVGAFSSLSLANFNSGVDGAHLIQAGLGQLNLQFGAVAVTLSDYGPNGLNQIDMQGGGLILGTAKNSVPVSLSQSIFGPFATVLALSLADGFVPIIGTTFTIINNRTSRPITGTFFGMAEGIVFTTDGVVFRITYLGGDGNDVVLTRVA